MELLIRFGSVRMDSVDDTDIRDLPNLYPCVETDK